MSHFEKLTVALSFFEGGGGGEHRISSACGERNFSDQLPSCKKVSINLLTVRLKDFIRGSRLLLQGVGARCFAGGLMMAQH